MSKRILITGSAGFIGYHMTKKLLSEGYSVVSIDNLNDYYSVQLKKDRLAQLGIVEVVQNEVVQNEEGSFHFWYGDLVDNDLIQRIFTEYNISQVIHLAAQPGVRYSLENPSAYIQSNIVGFAHLIENAKNHQVEHFIYASSSSVYGKDSTIPYSTEENVDNPVSLYGATKKSNELMAHSYSHLFGMRTTGVRLFTVYGEWGRPDMATMLFADAISQEKPIKVFNGGDMSRDFTYVGDIIEGIFQILNQEADNRDNYMVYNIGNSQPVQLLEFILTMEKAFGRKAEIEMHPMQPGDMQHTYADVSALQRDYGYAPNTSLKTGIEKFTEWYKAYHALKTINAF